MNEIRLEDNVTIVASNIRGKVIGYATHTKALDLYQVEYVDGIGNVHAPWLYEADIKVIIE